MNRALRIVGGVLIAVALVAPRSIAEQDRPPNIVFIMADDLGYGGLGSYGQKLVRTPRLDRMAAEGMRFTSAYAGSCMCAPSRASLMLGWNTGHTPVLSNGDPGLRPEDADRTLPALLKRAGYATGGFGKWGLGNVEAPGAPWRQGFDSFFGYLDQTHAHFFYTDYLMRNDHRVPLSANEGGRRGVYSHDVIVDEALAFIRENRDRPFFAYLGLTLPHAEILAPEDSMAKYVGKFPETPYVGDHYASQPTPRAAYAGMIDRLDRDAGRVIDLIAELGLENDTIIVFTSDNGPITAGGSDPAFFGNAGPLRGLKFTFYEGGIRVPFIVRWPGRVAARSVSDRPVGFQDVLPTAADLAGIDLAADVRDRLDGATILPTLLGQEQAERGPLYWEMPGPRDVPGLSQAGRIGHYKGIIPRPGAPLEVYDLEADIGETLDLSAKQPDLARQFVDLFEHEHVDLGR